MLYSIIGAATLCMVSIYVWYELYGGKINFKKAENYIYFLLLVVCVIVNYNYNELAFKIVTTLLTLGVFNWLIFRRNIRETIIGTIVLELLMIVSETIFAIIIALSIDIDSMEFIMQNYFGVLMTNIIIAMIAVFFMQFNIVKRIYHALTKATSKIGIPQLTLITLFVVMSYNLIFFNTYNKSDFSTILIVNTLLMVLYTFVTFKMVKAQNNYILVNSKYITVLDSLKEYEKMLDQYKIMNHENKNQLLTVRSMIVKKEKKITNYIDTIINEKIKDDEKLMFDTSIIPEGGLRAVVYSKILYMKNNEMEFYLNIDRKVRSFDFVNLGDELIWDICKIVSIYLDNAIDAAKGMIDGNVSIKFYMENEKLCIAIANTFDYINLEQIDSVGYTTKEEGHGYGLPLAKKILEKNHNLSNQRQINDNVFTQVLKITI